MREQRHTTLANGETLYTLGITLIFAGILAILLAILLFLISTVKRGEKIRSGGAIIIGPFPIIFGTDKESVKRILLFSLALTIVLVILIVILYLVFR
jgi:uncharacterized protein (TIGR00304 family)